MAGLIYKPRDIRMVLYGEHNGMPISVIIKNCAWLSDHEDGTEVEWDKVIIAETNEDYKLGEELPDNLHEAYVDTMVDYCIEHFYYINNEQLEKSVNELHRDEHELEWLRSKTQDLEQVALLLDEQGIARTEFLSEIKLQDRLSRFIRRQEILSLSIAQLNITLRLYNILKNSDLFTVGAIINKTEKQIIGLKNMGRISFKELKDLLIENGLEFRRNDNFTEMK